MSDVLVRRVGRRALITLNRPKALNALNQGMIESMTKTYETLVEEGSTDLIVLDGAGEKAFCAGGDVRAIWEDKSGSVGRTFFSHEYRLDYGIATLSRHKVDHVALVDGICMGGGVGVSVHGPYRVATERTMFAMPETAIGLFPDVGGSYFLPRLPDELGTYLGLTGARLKGFDVVAAGIATHYIESAQLPALREALLENGIEALPQHCADVSDQTRFSRDNVAQLRERTAQLFAFDSMEEIVAALERDGSEWAVKQLATLKRLSPSSLKVTLRMLRAAPATLEETFALEHRLGSRVLERPDFFEGVRSVLVDKDNSPKWNPDTLAKVDTDFYFEPRESEGPDYDVTSKKQ